MQYLSKSDVKLRICRKLPEFDMLLNYLILTNPKIYILNIKDEVHQIAFSKSFYMPSGPNFFKKKSKKKITENSIYHESMHVACFRKLGPKLHKRPRSTLLAECLASLLEFYFFLSTTATDSTEYANLWSVYYKSANILGMDCLKTFNKSSKNPFKAFQIAVTEMTEIYEELLNLKKQYEFASPIGPAIRKLFEKRKMSPFFYHYDFPGNLLFVEAHCGLVSDADDQKAFSRIFSKLKKSKNMSEFLEWITTSS